MPVSSAALRQKAEALRLLRTPTAQASAPALKPGQLTGRVPARPIWAKAPFACQHGQCLALELRQGQLWVCVKDTDGQQGWAPVARILAPDQRRTWARTGFG